MLEQGMLAFALLGAGWVLWLLVGLSVGVVAVALERALALARSTTPPRALNEAVNAFLAEGDAGVFKARLEALGGAEARILAAGAEVADAGTESAGFAMEGATAAVRLELERGLAFVGTVGSNAPFLGLFGTVLGIIQAFQDLSVDTKDASAAVMAGISEALVATAVGLLVAIPAVVLYNVLGRAVKARLSRAGSLGSMVLARIAKTAAGKAA